jgi:hypothetical protein
MTCPICQRHSKTEGACRICTLKVAGALTELPSLQWEAGFFLEPSRGGSGSVSAERSIGINVNALDFAIATDLLAILHGWEQVIRRDRRLTPPALVAKEPTIEAEVQATCDFHLAHLDWSLSQDWGVEFSSEVLQLHARGRAATKKFKEQARRIPCPTDDCKKFVVIDVENLTVDVSCFGCKQTWTVLRLVALAMANPNRRFFLDVEAIALWLQMSQREVYRIIRKFKIERQGGTYDLSAIIKAKQEVI